jgi:hypothetical protein
LKNPVVYRWWILVVFQMSRDRFKLALELLSKIFRFRWTESARFLILSFNRIVNFLPVHRDFLGGIDAQPNFVSTNIHNGDDYVISNHDAFVSMSRQDQHGWLLLKLIIDCLGLKTW